MSLRDSEVRRSRTMRRLDVATIGASIFVPTGIAAGVAGPARILDRQAHDG